MFNFLISCLETIKRATHLAGILNERLNHPKMSNAVTANEAQKFESCITIAWKTY